MSAEDLPEAVNSENMDEGSREVVKGIILITDEGDEVESKAKGILSSYRQRASVAA